MSTWFKVLLLPTLVIAAGYLYALQRQADIEVQHSEAIGSALTDRLEQVSDGVRERLSLYAHGISSLRSSIVAQGLDTLDYQYISTYSISQNFPSTYPGARGLGFIRVVEQEDIAEFVTKAAQDRPDKSFSIRTITSHNNNSFIIQYILPEAINQQAIGLDIGSEAMRRESAIKAAYTDSVQLTAPITLVQADKKELHGFLILQPVYRSLDSRNTTMDNVLGWTYAPLLIGEILNTVGSIDSDIALSISDLTGKNPVHFFESNKAAVISDKYKIVKMLNLYGRQWHLTIYATPDFISSLRLPSESQSLWNTMLITICLSLIVFSIQILVMRFLEAKSHQQEIEVTKRRLLEKSNEELERKVTERTFEIQRANALQTSILESAEYSIIATDEQGVISLFNPGAEKLLGYAAADLVGRKSPALFHLETEVVKQAEKLTEEFGYPIRPGFEVFIHKAKLGMTDNNIWTYVSKDGRHITVRLSVTSLTDSTGKTFGFLGVAYDLTQQIANERELSDAKELAEAANRAKSEFLANMSHEIRTPMNGIYGVLQVLKKEEGDTENSRLIDKALQSTKNLSVIINDILDFSKIEAGKLTLNIHPFSIASLLRSVQSEMDALLYGKATSFTILNTLQGDDWLGDESRLRQVLINVCSNAIKFTEKGEVTVSVSLNSSGAISIQVRDTGIGMSDEQLSRVFVRFEQADASTTRKYGGTGIGLAITLSLVDLMGGSINVQSAAGQGTCVTITIPLSKAYCDANQNDINTDQSLSHNFTEYSVLVAEDNEINRIVIEELLKQTGATLHFAVNGKNALNIASEERLDIVLMDIQMPVMDGVEACEKIKAVNPKLPIIALTANVMVEDIQLYKQKGFDDHLAKPVEYSQLVAKMALCLEANSK